MRKQKYYLSYNEYLNKLMIGHLTPMELGVVINILKKIKDCENNRVILAIHMLPYYENPFLEFGAGRNPIDNNKLIKELGRINCRYQRGVRHSNEEHSNIFEKIEFLPEQEVVVFHINSNLMEVMSRDPKVTIYHLKTTHKVIKQLKSSLKRTLGIYENIEEVYKKA